MAAKSDAIGDDAAANGRRGARARRWAVGGAAAAALMVAGCADDGGVNRQAVGTIAGAATGAAIGSTIGAGGGRTAAVIIGGLLGGLAGGEIGRRMDEEDRYRAGQATNSALENTPSYDEADWRNPSSGYSGTIRPEPHFYNDAGQVCRDYTQTVSVRGRTETARGVACRNDDGTWRVVS